MEQPPGYPPPTLIRRKSRVGGLRFGIILIVLAAALGFYVVNNLLDNPPAPPIAAEPAATEESSGGEADSNPAALPVTAEPPVTVDAPGADGAPAQPSIDARQPNRWYYVNVLGDGPAAIYSRDGGQWSFAFACTARTRMIEFIAVGIGVPGDFDKQAISIGKVRLMMDATWSKDGGGTISTRLPAAHPFFNAVDGSAPMEVQLVATRKTILPVGPEVIRLIRGCRG